MFSGWTLNMDAVWGETLTRRVRSMSPDPLISVVTDREVDGTDYISGVEKKSNSLSFFFPQTHVQVFTPVNASTWSLVYSAAPDMKLQCMFGKEDTSENIKAASTLMLPLKKTAAKVGRSSKTAARYIAGSYNSGGDKITSSTILAVFNRHHNEAIVDISAEQNISMRRFSRYNSRSSNALFPPASTAWS